MEEKASILNDKVVDLFKEKKKKTGRVAQGRWKIKQKEEKSNVLSLKEKQITSDV